MNHKLSAEGIILWVPTLVSLVIVVQLAAIPPSFQSFKKENERSQRSPALQEQKSHFFQTPRVVISLPEGFARRIIGYRIRYGGVRDSEDELKSASFNNRIWTS